MNIHSRNILGKIRAIGLSFAGSSLTKSVAYLTSSSAAAKLIAFSSLPLITRLYSPSDFGEFSIFVATLGLMVPLATLRFSAAIPLPRRTAPAINILALCLLTTVTVALVSVILIGLAQLLAENLGLPMLQSTYWLIAIGVLATGIFESLNAWALRRKRFKTIALATMSQSISSVILKLLLGVFGMKAGGLILGQVSSVVLGTASIAKALLEDIQIATRRVSVRRMRTVFIRFITFPKYRLPAQFLLVFSTQLPILFLGFYFGKDIAGQLGLTLTCIAVPISLISTSLGQVFFAEMADLGKDKPHQIRALVRSLLQTSIALIVFPVAVLAYAGPLVFEIVFGDQWMLAGAFAQVFSIYLGVQFCAVPLINTFSVFGDQLSFLFINSVRVLLSVAVFCVTYILELDMMIAVSLYSVTLTCHYVFVIWSIFKMVDRECSENI